MGFQSFEILARAGLKRSTMGSAKIVIKTSFHDGSRRPETVFRFSDEIIEKAGLKPGTDRIDLQIDQERMKIKATKKPSGGYKLLKNGKSGGYVKYTAARGMPVVDEAVEVLEALVVENSIVFNLPKAARLCAG